MTEDKLDYDRIMTFYQNLLQKEKKQFEEDKVKKIREVDYWARAIKEEERLAIIKYCEQYGESEMKQIQKAIEERHQKELKMKRSLEKAMPVLLKFKEEVMKVRRADHEDKMIKFINKIGAEVKTKIHDSAKSELQKLINKRKTEQANKLRDEKYKKQLEENKE